MRSRVVVCLGFALSFLLGMVLQAVRASGSRDDQTRVTGIGGVFFKANEPQKLAGWYRQHLGIALQAAGSEANSPAFSAFEWREKSDPAKLGTTVLAIFPESSKYFEPSRAPFMINFRVANLDRIRTQLREEGVVVDDKINDESNGRFGWATDPEGNRFELWEPK